MKIKLRRGKKALLALKAFGIPEMYAIQLLGKTFEVAFKSNCPSNNFYTIRHDDAWAIPAAAVLREINN